MTEIRHLTTVNTDAARVYDGGSMLRATPDPEAEHLPEPASPTASPNGREPITRVLPRPSHEIDARTGARAFVMPRADQALRADLMLAGLPVEWLTTPRARLSNPERQSLAAAAANPATIEALQLDKARTITHLLGLGETTGRPRYARLAAALEVTPPPHNLADALLLRDLLGRMRRVESLTDVAVRARRLLDEQREGLITEVIFTFRHSGQGLSDPALAPSGFRMSVCWDTPSEAGACTEERAIKWGVLPVNESDGLRYAHFVESQSSLAGPFSFAVYLRAFNAQQSSGPSNVISVSFPAARRGDLNANGRYDSGDVDALLGQLLDGEFPQVLADLDRDGVLTEADLDELLRRLAAQPE